MVYCSISRKSYEVTMRTRHYESKLICLETFSNPISDILWKLRKPDWKPTGKYRFPKLKYARPSKKHPDRSVKHFESNRAEVIENKNKKTEIKRNFDRIQKENSKKKSKLIRQSNTSREINELYIYTHNIVTEKVWKSFRIEFPAITVSRL